LEHLVSPDKKSPPREHWWAYKHWPWSRSFRNYSCFCWLFSTPFKYFSVAKYTKN